MSASLPVTEARFGTYFIQAPQSSELPEESVRECAAIALKHVRRAMDADLLFGRPGGPGCTCDGHVCGACFKRSSARFAYEHPESVAWAQRHIERYAAFATSQLNW